MKTFIWSATLVAILAGAVIAWSGFTSAHAARAALANASTKSTAVAEEINRTRTRLAEAERDLGELSAALKLAQAAAEKPSVPANSAKTSRVRPPSEAAVLESHPELRGLWRQNQWEKIRTDYRSFLNAAGVTPAQRRRFEELMLDSAEQKLDLEATSETQGLARANPGIAKLQQQMDEKLQAAQKELLGPTAFQQLQDLKRLQPQHDFVGKVADQVALTEARFTAAQRSQLLNVMATSTREDTGASREESPHFITNAWLWKATDWPRVMAQAQTFLSPPQLAALKGHAANAQTSAIIREYSRREGIPLQR